MANVFVRCAPVRRQLPRIPFWRRGSPVFISYRRSASAFASGWLRDRLVAKLGEQRVIRDFESIPAGVSFIDFMEGVIPDCGTLLALIDAQWSVSAAMADGRYDEMPGDMMAFELDCAFAAGVDVIPVLLPGASMPNAAELPQRLRRFSQLNGVEVRPDHNFCSDVDRIVTAVRRR